MDKVIEVISGVIVVVVELIVELKNKKRLEDHPLREC